MTRPLLSVDLQVDYPNKPQDARGQSPFRSIRARCLGWWAKAGQGKSTIALAILRLLALKGGRAHGHIWFRGRDLMEASERDMRRVRGREIGLVLQSPLSSLNPALRIGTQLAEAWRAHATGTKAELTMALARALDSVGLSIRRGVLLALSLAGQRRSGATRLDCDGGHALACACSLPTNPPARSMPSPRRKSSSSSPNCSARWAAPFCTSRTTCCPSPRSAIALQFFTTARSSNAETPAPVLERPMHPYTRQLLASAALASRSAGSRSSATVSDWKAWLRKRSVPTFPKWGEIRW